MELHPIANLSTLPDTGITTPTIHDFLQYDGSKWVNTQTPTFPDDWTWLGTSTADWSDAAKTIKVKNNTANAFLIKIEGGALDPALINYNSTSGVHLFEFGSTLTDPTFNFLGLGAFNKTGTGATSLGGTLQIGLATNGLFLDGNTITAVDSDGNRSLILNGIGTGDVKINRNSGDDGLRVYDGSGTADNSMHITHNSMTSSTGTISLDNENLITTGIVTANEFNTTGSVGSAGTLASFGVDGAAAPSFAGLVEIATDSSNTLPAGLDAALVIQSNINAPDIDSFGLGSATFANVTGVISGSDNAIALFGNITGDATLSNSIGISNLTGLQFEVTNSADHILSGIATRKIITKGIFVVSNFSDTGFETSGTRAVRDNFGADINSNMRGLYNSTNDGSNFGLCITVTDALDDASTGDITSIGLDITVPVGSTHGGGGVLTSLAARFGDGGITDFSKFEADGTLEFNGAATVFEDIPISLSSARVPAANAPTWASFISNLNAYTYGVDDFQEFSTEIKHSYKQGSDIEFHIHGATNGLEGVDKTIKFEVEYELIDNNTSGDFGDTYTGTTIMNGEIIILANTADKTSFVIDVGIDGTGNFLQGATVVGRIRRIASTGTEPASDPFVVQVGMHVEQDTVGSRTELVK